MDNSPAITGINIALPTGLIQTPYPPFGLVTTAFFGLAAFLFLIGVYSSAISVSQDRNIRMYIKNYAKQLTFLSGIGSSEMEKEMQKIVKNVMTEVEEMTQTLENTTGIESSFQEQDIKEYVKIAIQGLEVNKQSVNINLVPDLLVPRLIPKFLPQFQFFLLIIEIESLSN